MLALQKPPGLKPISILRLYAALEAPLFHGCAYILLGNDRGLSENLLAWGRG